MGKRYKELLSSEEKLSALILGGVLEKSCRELDDFSYKEWVVCRLCLSKLSKIILTRPFAQAIFVNYPFSWLVRNYESF